MNSDATSNDRRYPWYVRLIFALQRRRYGAELESARVWGRIPKAFLALTLLYRALDRSSSPLDSALRSLLTVRVSQINWCQFCVDLNSAVALERHVTETKLAALPDFEHSPFFSEQEKAALAYAEMVTRFTGKPDEALMARLKAHFDEDAIIELTALIAFQNLSSKFNAALAIPPQGFCRHELPGTE